MRMPGIDGPVLAPHLETLRQTVMGLPRPERQQLMGVLHGDILIENDARYQAAYERAERERSRKRPDPRQMSLEGVAA